MSLHFVCMEWNQQKRQQLPENPSILAIEAMTNRKQLRKKLCDPINLFQIIMFHHCIFFFSIDPINMIHLNLGGCGTARLQSLRVPCIKRFGQNLIHHVMLDDCHERLEPPPIPSDKAKEIHG